METIKAGYEQATLILDNLFTYVALLDLEGRVLEMNSPPLMRGGHAKQAIIGQLFFDTPWWTHDPEVRQQLMTAIQQAAAGETSRYDVVVRMGQENIPIDFMISPIRNTQGEVVALLPTAVEITHRKKLEEQLAQREEQYRFVLEGSELGFWDWNIATGTVERNARWAEMLGYTHEEMLHTTQQWTDFIFEEDRERAWHSISEVLAGRAPLHKLEYRMLHKDGSLRWILDQAKIMQRDAQGQPTRMCGTHTDITERKHLELLLEKQAHIDHLTGLDNRRYFLEKAEKELKRAKRHNTPLTMLMLDIDHFKRINDTYGHKAGDQVLKRLAAIFTTTLREIDIIGRIGGEEFAVLLPETGPGEAQEVAERLRTRIMEAAVSIEHGLPIRFTISIGAVTQHYPETNIDVLLSDADQALYEAKRQGRNRVISA